MKVNRNDLTQMENLMKALKRAKFELEGLEVLALADIFKWFSKFGQMMQIDIQQQEEQEKKASQPLMPIEQKNTLVESPPEPQPAVKQQPQKASQAKKSK